MSVSQQQYTAILNDYSARRRENKLTEHRRRNEIYSLIPDIRHIDENIAHISMDKARQMLFQPQKDRREELRQAIHSLSMEKVNLLVLHGYPCDYLDPIYTCPLCKDTGRIGAEPCQCFRRRMMDILYDQSNLKEILKTENYAAFNPGYYSEDAPDPQKPSPRANALKQLEKSRTFVRKFDSHPGQNLLIYGSAGVGKTFLSHCIADEILKAGKSVIYLTSWQFFHELEEDTFHREAWHRDSLPTILNCDLLIIDDLGTELNNAFVNSRLFLCINERILHHRSTIISTNLSLKQLSETYTERISSRIIESYTLMHLYGEDIRIRKAFSSLDES